MWLGVIRMRDKPECGTCGIKREEVKGGWCDSCWEVAKKKVLDKYLCSVCGDALPKKGDCECGGML